MFEENSFANVLKTFRMRKGKVWTQKRTAELLGVAERTYKGWENGERIPSDKKLKNITTVLGLDEASEATLYRAAAQVPPEIHNLPFPQNPFFTGRETQLERLGQYLKENGSVALTQPVSISGLGGIGKTQLALEYAHQSYPTVYRAVFWVNAADKTTLQADYDSLAHMLELPERNERESDRRIQAVKRWLEGHTNWLLILDNADDLQLARSFLPVKHHGHILLTTRSHIVGTIARQIEMEEMKPDEGLLFLLRRSGMLQDKTKLDTIASNVRDTAIELVTLLGGNPLALDQAGAYIEETGASFADYMQLYHEERRFLLDRRGSSGSPYGEHPETVAATLEISFKKAYEQQPMSVDVLHFCSFLQPDAIPEEVLHQADGLKLDTTSFNEVIFALQRYSLIKRHAQEKTFSIHRLVQAVLIEAMSPDLRKQWRERVVRAVNAAFPEVEFKEWNRCGRLLPHALVCAAWTEHELIPTPEVSELLHKAGVYLRERGLYSEALPLLVRALSIREQHLGAEYLDTGKSLHDLAILYRRQGKYEQVEPLYQRALSIYEQQLGAGHPDTASVLNNLAVLYWEQGKYELAEPLYQQALAIREQHLGAERPLTMSSINNLASLYYDQGKYEQAEPLYQRALSVREKRLGVDHPDTMRVMSNLAELYRQQGKHELAEPLLERALALREEHLGAEHPDTAHSLHNLAELYRQQGKYEQAEILYERALAIREQHLGTEHPATARSLHRLAKLSQDQGRHERAEALYKHAHCIQEQRLGATHPHTQETRKDYVAFLRSIGQDAEAAAIESNQS